VFNRNISVHLQDFPNVSFINDNAKLMHDMDMVRAICSTALSIRDNKNLRVRLPLNQLKIIGKNAAQIADFKDIIAEEVNVKNIIIEEKIDEIAELKLQINFKKIGAKYGPKVKAITEAARQNQWKKISNKEIEIAGVNLIDDEFEIKLTTKNNDDKKFVILPLSTNDCLIALDIEVTENLMHEGIARDIVRAIQQSRKSANLNVSDHISICIFSSNKLILQVANNFSSYIKEQVLANKIEVVDSANKVSAQEKVIFESKIDDGDLVIGLTVS